MKLKEFIVMILVIASQGCASLTEKFPGGRIDTILLGCLDQGDSQMLFSGSSKHDHDAIKNKLL